ncbi:hypothetical protein ACFFQF_28170 [Haladaptatus pallidirubidus]|uniref:hypothetical protein n=1 Tax=Haladaptatus pallidirubidus TaxID=1008152 RepID=UPI0035F03E4B
MLISAFLSYPESDWLTWGDTYAIDSRANGSQLRKTIEDADPDTDPLALADRIRSEWSDDLDEFRRIRRQYLLYGGPRRSRLRSASAYCL